MELLNRQGAFCYGGRSRFSDEVDVVEFDAEDGNLLVLLVDGTVETRLCCQLKDASRSEVNWEKEAGCAGKVNV